MNPEISNLMMQGYTIAEAQAEIKSWQIIPAPITVVHTPNGYVYSDGIARPDMQIDYSGPCAMTSDGQPCVVITLVSYGKYSPTERDYESVENARHEVFLAEVERINQFRSERYQIGELELKVFPNSPQEMWDALNAAKTALDRGSEFEIHSAIQNLQALVNPTPVELVQLPLSEGKQAMEDEITAAHFASITRGENPEPPKLPEPEYAALVTKEECHLQWNTDVLDRAKNKWRRGMFTCLCKDPMCPYFYGYGKKNYALLHSPEFFVFCEDASASMRTLADAANKNWQEPKHEGI